MLLLAFAFTFAQENCTNGIDDDDDGFIDLNDSDCDCIENENLIFNGNFELYEELPVEPNQLEKARGWIFPSNAYDIHFALADYFHADSYSPIQSFPYPSGGGIAGITHTYQILGNGGNQTYLDFYSEYIGTRLEETLEPGITYVFSIFVYRQNENDNADWPLLNVGLWGKNSSLRAYEIDFARCPDYHEEWSELTRIPFYPEKKWTKIEMEFTVEETISSLIIGLTCDIPFRYYNIRGSKLLALDNISIRKKSEDFSIASSGVSCSDNLILYAENSTNFIPTSYQWYQDGIAIPGATQSSFSITDDMPEAYYSVRAMNENSCRNSHSYAYIKPVFDFRYQIEVNDFEKTVRLFDIWNQSDYVYSINDIDYQAIPRFTNVPMGEGIVYVKNQDGCLVKTIPFVIFEMYNVITPNNDGMNDTWVIDGIEHYPGTQIKIYDRLGVQKYDYTIPENLNKFEWNATAHGTPVSSGEFWYFIKINDGRIISGSLTIKRN